MKAYKESIYGRNTLSLRVLVKSRMELGPPRTNALAFMVSWPLSGHMDCQAKRMRSGLIKVSLLIVSRSEFCSTRILDLAALAT